MSIVFWCFGLEMFKKFAFVFVQVSSCCSVVVNVNVVNLSFLKGTPSEGLEQQVFVENMSTRQ